MKLKPYFILWPEDWSETHPAVLIYASTEEVARYVALAEGPFDGRSVNDECSLDDLMVYCLLGKGLYEREGDRPYQCTEVGALRTAGFRYDDDALCDSCGLAEMNDRSGKNREIEWGVCLACMQCGECGHDEECTGEEP